MRNNNEDNNKNNSQNNKNTKNNKNKGRAALFTHKEKKTRRREERIAIK